MTDLPLTYDILKAHTLSGCKKRSDFQIGVEWEKIGIYRNTGKAIPYSGATGVEAIFKALIQRYGWVPAVTSTPIIALKKGGHSITLEPGGQIELSGQKALNIESNAAEIYFHLKEVESISNELGIAWLGIGAQPNSIDEEIEWVPKPRYKIMRERLVDDGNLTFLMMKETASVQVSLDYENEADAILKLKLGMGLAPFLVAMFANSPLRQGRSTGFLSRRAHIWEHTTLSRSGILWDELDLKKGIEGYLEYVLNAPMLFLLREEMWISVSGLSFREFMEEGYQGLRANLDDWVLHLSSIFTEARLKNYVEIRSIDCQKVPMGLSAVAFIKGLFYHEPSKSKAFQIISQFSGNELKKLYHEASIHGLQAPLPGGKKIGDLCRELFSLSEAGLGAEKKYLAPLKSNLDHFITPAEQLLKCLERGKTIFECAALSD